MSVAFTQRKDRKEEANGEANNFHGRNWLRYEETERGITCSREDTSSPKEKGENGFGRLYIISPNCLGLEF